MDNCTLYNNWITDCPKIWGATWLTDQRTVSTQPSDCSIVRKFRGSGGDLVHFVRRPLFRLLYQPRMMDDDEYDAFGWMRTGRGNRNIRREPASMSLCPPQIPLDLTRARTRAAALGNWRSTRHGRNQRLAAASNSCSTGINLKGGVQNDQETQRRAHWNVHGETTWWRSKRTT
jgi:hypothetical protein